ncbi:MAG: 2-phosphoglycerate kinase [Methanomassiliicoccales archaeon]
MHIVKGDQRFPFSEGILAKSLSRAGLPHDEVYELAREIHRDLDEEDVLEQGELAKMVSRYLLERGYERAERYYRVINRIRYLETPMVVLIGGGTGVGKSSIASEVAHRLGITRSIGSDGIREIMRFMMPRELMPVLHESSFAASRHVKDSLIKDTLIYTYSQQVSLVAAGVMSFIRRGIREGLHTVIDGIHLVPGFLDIDTEEPSCYLFHYVLHLEDKDRHIQHIYFRSEGSLRNPERYVNQIENIRRIQEFIVESAESKGVRVIENEDFDGTVQTILDDIIMRLEHEV